MLSIQLHIATEQWNMTSVIEELKFELHLISINLKSKQSKVARGCRIGQYSLRHWIRTFDSVKPRSKTQTQYSVHLMWRADSLEKTLMLEKTEGRRRRGWQRTRWLDELASLTQWTWVWTNSRSWWWTGRPGVLQSMGSQRVGHNWATGLNSIFECLLTVSYLILPSAPYILKLGKLIRKPKFFPLVLVGDSKHVSPCCVGEPSPQPHPCK